MKLCTNSKCTIKEPQSLDNFCKDKNRKSGYYPYCKQCRRIHKKSYGFHKEVRARYKEKHPERLKNSDLKKCYGITIVEYNQMLLNQNDSCLICKVHKSNFKRALSVDHDHKTGKIRGLLCAFCNTGLGYFKDNVEFLERAIKYLKG